RDLAARLAFMEPTPRRARMGIEDGDGPRPPLDGSPSFVGRVRLAELFAGKFYGGARYRRFAGRGSPSRNAFAIRAVCRCRPGLCPGPRRQLATAPAARRLRIGSQELTGSHWRKAGFSRTNNTPKARVAAAAG